MTGKKVLSNISHDSTLYEKESRQLFLIGTSHTSSRSKT